MRMKKMDSKIASRISEVKGKMSQEEFAMSIHSSQSSISKVLAGEQPSIGILTSIADVYKVSVDWLLGRSSRKYATGNSRFNNGNPVTYGDGVALLNVLLENNSVEFSRSEGEMDYYVENNNLSLNDNVIVQDKFLADLFFSLSSLKKNTPATVDSWLKSVLTEYDIPIMEWNWVLQNAYRDMENLNRKANEVLREKLEEQSEKNNK